MSLSIDGGCGSSGKHAKEKIEGAIAHAYYVDPLYGTKLDIIFDRKTKLSRTSLSKEYGINNQRIAPKKLKIKKEIKEEKVETLFGPCKCNGYRYCHNKDKALISRVETLWMIMHK
jgi:hypothetical protein